MDQKELEQIYQYVKRRLAQDKAKEDERHEKFMEETLNEVMADQYGY